MRNGTNISKVRDGHGRWCSEALLEDTERTESIKQNHNNKYIIQQQ